MTEHDNEDPLYLPTASISLTKSTDKKSSSKNDEKGLGKWVFDKGTRKRYYISLNGSVHSGQEANQKAREEKDLALQPGISMRKQLCILMQSMVIPTIPSQHLNRLESWGLPFPIVQKYASKGVTHLFDWQVECLLKPTVLTGGNIVYSAPTSGGKTLVSEILMLRRIALKGGTVFFVVPFVALAEEKTHYFQNMWGDMHIGIRPFHGEQTMSVLTSDVDVAVCTIEKANSLLNLILEEGRHEQLSMVIVDEIHMLEDSHRGFLLEVLLSKIKFLLPSRVQIVGMSATLPNMSDLSSWLGGQLYKTEYRPVSLAVKVCIGTAVYAAVKADTASSTSNLNLSSNMGDRSDSDVGKTKGNSSLPPFNAVFVPERELPEPALYGLDDLTSNIALLCLETVLQRKSIIVFCNSKRNCEIQAAIIAKVIFHYQKNDQGGNTHHNVEKQSKHGNTVEGGNPGIGTPAPRLSPTELRDLRRNRLLLMESLRQTQAGLHSDLRVPLQYGVAFHHAGLMGEQRKLIEEAFHNNVIRVICATSTLAAGVNLPANRVIVTSLRTGREPLTVASFRQMVGRAGRKGLDEYGEAFLLIRPDASTPGTPIVEDGQAAVEYVTGEMLPLHSSIVLGKGGGLEKLLLDTIYFGSLPHNLDHENNLPCISSWKDVHAFVGCTLFSQQNASAGENGLARVQECTVRALQFLWKYTFLLHVDSTFQYNTNTGTTTSRAELASSKDSKDVEDIKDVEGSMNSSQSRDSTTSLKPNGFWPSSLGKATVLSGIPPHEAVQTIRYLEQAKDNLILTGNVQPLFLLTPPINRIVVPWTEYANIYQALLVACPEVEEPATHIGINRARLIRYQQMPPTRSIDQAKEETLLDTRFYATMVLLCVLNEKPIHSIVDMMNISAADIHFLRTQASLFCRINVTFCRALNWPLLAAVLEAFTDNLHFGVQEELLPLMRIGTQYMHIQRAKNLYKHGIKSVLDIIAAPDDLLVHILMGEVSFDGKRVIQVNLVSANGKRKVDGSTTKASKDDQGTDIINSHHKENREALSRAELITSCSRLCATLKTRAAKYIEEENRLHRMLGAVC